MHFKYRVMEVFVNESCEPWLGTFKYWERTRGVAMSYTHLKTIVYIPNKHTRAMSKLRVVAQIMC